MQTLKNISFFDLMSLLMFYAAVTGQLIIPVYYVFSPTILEITLRMVGEIIKHQMLNKKQ